MIANYHTHTWRCNHAGGREEDYVRNAVARKFEILGFSDHTPYIFPGSYESGFRMLQNQLEDYCHVVRKLQEHFAGQIRIPLGVEMEYYPAYFNETLALLRDAGIEYLLLGQHFVGNEIDEHYSGNPTGDVSILKKYCFQVADAMQTGLFTYLAHPDLIHFRGDARQYREHMRLVCTEARNCGIPLEVNMLGHWSGRQYPNPAFWEIAAEEGCSIVMGCDAHAPEHLKKEDTEQQLLRMIGHYGLKLLDRVDLRKIN